MNHDGKAEGSILLQDVHVADRRQNDFMFDDAPQFVPGISSTGSEYIFG